MMIAFILLPALKSPGIQSQIIPEIGVNRVALYCLEIDMGMRSNGFYWQSYEIVADK